MSPLRLLSAVSLGLLVALPVKYHIYFGEPLHFTGDYGKSFALFTGSCCFNRCVQSKEVCLKTYLVYH